MDLDRDARRILDLATDARAPVADDKARVEKKLGALLGVSVVATAGQEAATQAAQAASTASGGAKAASSVALKWWMAAAAAATTYAAVVSLAPAPQEPPAAPAIAAQPSTPPAEEPEPALALPIKEAAPAPVLPGVPERPTHAIAPKKQAAGNTLGQELELLHRAQAAWRARDAGDALALIDEHRARFPRSELKLERDGLRILTLCELGRTAEATALAKKLLARAPRSPLRATIEESCALK